MIIFERVCEINYYKHEHIYIFMLIYLVEVAYYLKQIFCLLCDKSVTSAEAIPYFSLI